MKMPIPDDWNGEDCKRLAVCWPDSSKWIAILHGLIETPGQGRFWDEATGNIIATQESFRPYYDYNFETEEVIMSCNDNVSNALLAIAASLQNQAAGGSACGCLPANVSVQAVLELPSGANWLVLGNNPLPALPEAGFPDGYTGEEDYSADKCAKATKIVNDLIATLEQMTQVNWAVGVIGAAAILACLVGLITVPEVVVPLLLFAMVGNVGIVTALNLTREYITENKDDFICILYEQESVEGVIDATASLLAAALVALGIGEALGVVVTQIILWLLNGDTLGTLFTSGAKGIYPNAECAPCLPSATFVNMANGEYLTERLSDTDFRAVYNPGNTRYEMLVAVNHNPDDHTSFADWIGPMFVCGYEVLSGAVSGVAEPPSPVRFFNQSSGSLGGGSDPQPDSCFAWLILVSSVAFDCRFTAVGPEC
jgi:hypothetical protein